jgi:hypothetical protein
MLQRYWSQATHSKRRERCTNQHGVIPYNKNIKLRYVFLLFGVYHSFKSIIISKKIQRLEEMMMITTKTLATHTKCSDLEADEL